MKAARWHGRRDVRVEDVPIPTPGRGEILLRVSLCGICGTDLEEYRHGPIVIPADRPHAMTGRRAPLTMGHEFTGAVVYLKKAREVTGYSQFEAGTRFARKAAELAKEARKNAVASSNKAQENP